MTVSSADTGDVISISEALVPGTFVILDGLMSKITFTREGQIVDREDIGWAMIFGRVTNIGLTIEDTCVQGYRRTVGGYEETEDYYTFVSDPSSQVTIVGEKPTYFNISDCELGDIGRYYGYYHILVYDLSTQSYSFKDLIYITWAEGMKVRVVELTSNVNLIRLFKPDRPTTYIPMKNEVVYIIPGISGDLIVEDIYVI